MRNLVLNVGSKFGKGLVVTIGNKQRVVAKARCSVAFGGDMSFYNAFKKQGLVYTQRVIWRSNKRQSNLRMLASLSCPSPPA